MGFQPSPYPKAGHGGYPPIHNNCTLPLYFYSLGRILPITPIPFTPYMLFSLPSLHHYNVTTLHCYIITSLHCYIITSLQRYIVTSLHHYIITCVCSLSKITWIVPWTLCMYSVLAIMLAFMCITIQCLASNSVWQC